MATLRQRLEEFPPWLVVANAKLSRLALNRKGFSMRMARKLSDSDDWSEFKVHTLLRCCHVAGFDLFHTKRIRQAIRKRLKAQ